MNQEEEGKTEGEHIQRRKGEIREAGVSKPPDHGKNGLKVHEHHVERNFPNSSSHPDGTGCSGRQRRAQPPKLISAVLKNGVLNSSGLEFGFKIILTAYHLVRFSPSLQPDWLFPEQHASSVLIWNIFHLMDETVS